MKKIYTLILLTITGLCMRANTYVISIVGNTYSPASLTVAIGDIVTISSGGIHVLAEVSQATWAANGTATLSTGFGIKTSDYTFTVTTTNPIYYICQTHANLGMKGVITVNTSGLIQQPTINENLTLFPNPTKQQFSIKFNSTESGFGSAKLYSVFGQEIQSVISNKAFNAGDNSFTVELPISIQAGVYCLQLNYNSNNIYRKIIIE